VFLPFSSSSPSRNMVDVLSEGSLTPPIKNIHHSLLMIWIQYSETDDKRKFLNKLYHSEKYQKTLAVQLQNLGTNDLDIPLINKPNFYKNNYITSKAYYETEDMGLAAFILPKGCKIEMHDHNMMFVNSKIMKGKVRIRCCDLVDGTKFYSQIDNLNPHRYEDASISEEDHRLEAKLVFDVEMSAGETLYLTPDRGNIHSIEAIEDSVFFDVILPNYDPEEAERNCNYFFEDPSTLNGRQEGDRVSLYFATCPIHMHFRQLE